MLAVAPETPFVLGFLLLVSWVLLAIAAIAYENKRAEVYDLKQEIIKLEQELAHVRDLLGVRA